MRYLITGHTGFKGSWLAAKLALRGESVFGLSLPPAPGGIFQRADLHRIMSGFRYSDIQDAGAVLETVRDFKPTVIYHMAAQALVPQGLSQPTRTIETNVMGSLNILEAIRSSDTVERVIYVTSDKVYEREPSGAPHREADRLGGVEPYAVSKAMADLLAQAWIYTFGLDVVQIVRGGNVIGGGDISPGRLVPDIISAHEGRKPLRVRNPKAVRPWQHVLDCLNGYDLVEKHRCCEHNIWNVGPLDAPKTVRELIVALSDKLSGPRISSELEQSAVADIEDGTLQLDCSAVVTHLGFIPRLRWDAAIAWTAEWYEEARSGDGPWEVTARQIMRYAELSPHEP